MNNMMTELLQELVSIDNQMDVIAERIESLEAEVKFKESFGNLVDDFSDYKNKYNEYIETLKSMNVFENKWCDVVRNIVSNNLSDNMPMIDPMAESLESLDRNIELMETLLPPLGQYQVSDFAEININFVEQYRNFLNKKNNVLVDARERELKNISDKYYTAIAETLKEYQVDGNTFEVDGVVYALQNHEDISVIYNAIADYENKKENELEDAKVVEIVGVPYSQTAPEIQAKFADRIKNVFNKEKVQEFAKEKTMELKSGAKVRFKQFAKKGKEVAKLVGCKLAATKHEVVESLKHYYSDVNVANNVVLPEEQPMLPAADENIFENSFENANNLSSEAVVSNESVELEPVQFDSIFNITPEILPEPTSEVTMNEPIVNEPVSYNPKEALLSKYSTLINDRVFGKHASNGLSQAEKEFEIDNYLDNLIKVGQEKYGDNFVEDIMNEATTEPIVWLMDEVAQGEKLREISDNTMNSFENMNEYELESYLGKVVPKDKYEQFEKLVSDYKVVNPNSDDFTASKEALKVMANELNLVKPISLTETALQEVEPSETVTPQYVSENVNQDVKEEKMVNVIDKMNEEELENYISSLNLSMEEMQMFQSLSQKYKSDYPGVTDYMTKKACIKTITDQRMTNQFNETNSIHM